MGHLECFFLISIQLIWKLSCATDCRWPGLHQHSLINGTLNWSFDASFTPGTKIEYSCEGENHKLIGHDVRECNATGSWTGVAPWCGVNTIIHKPVVLEIQPFSERLVDELTDGVASATSESPCLQIVAGLEHRFNLLNLIDLKVGLISIHTAKTFPLLNNNYRVDVPSGWSYRITTKTPSPSIVMWKDFLVRTNQLSFSIKSATSLHICEIELYGQADPVACRKPQIPSHGSVSLESADSIQVAIFSCKAGYQIRGPEQRSCVGTQWNGTQPICVQSESTTASERIPSSSTISQESEESDANDKEINSITTSVVHASTVEDESSALFTNDAVIISCAVVLSVLLVVAFGGCIGIVFIFLSAERRSRLRQIISGKEEHLYDQLVFRRA